MNNQTVVSPDLKNMIESLSIIPPIQQAESAETTTTITTVSFASIFSGISDSFSYFANQISAKILYPISNNEQFEQRRKEKEKTLGGVRIQAPFLEKQSEMDNHQALLTLDGMLFPTAEEGPLSKKGIVFAPGADGYYEDKFSGYIVSLIKQKLGDINIIILNYPTVLANQNKGTLTPDSMALTVASAFQYLVKNKDLQPDDIMIYGQSLGGVASIRGARLIQHQYPDAKNKLINERSFLNLPDVAYQLFGLLGGVMKFSTECALWTTTDVLEAWNEIKGRKFVIYSEYDGMVAKTHSLYQAIQDQAIQQSQEPVGFLSMEGERVSIGEHYREFRLNEEEIIIHEMQNMFDLVPTLESSESEFKI